VQSLLHRALRSLSGRYGDWFIEVAPLDVPHDRCLVSGDRPELIHPAFEQLIVGWLSPRRGSIDEA